MRGFGRRLPAQAVETELYLFFHIPKTAGTSVRMALEGWFARLLHDEALSPGQIAELDAADADACVVGHFGGKIAAPKLSLLTRFPNLPSDPRLRTFTFLRDPVDQALSYYQHRRARGLADIPLEDWMTRRIEFAYSRVFEARTEYEAVLGSFFFVGIAERLQESLDRLAGLLGRPTVSAARANAAEDKPNLSAALRSRCEQVLGYEYELYDRACRLLDDGGSRWKPEAQFTPWRQAQCGPVAEIDGPFDNEPAFACLRRVELTGGDGRPRAVFSAREPIEVRVRYTVVRPGLNISPALLLTTAGGEPVFSAAFPTLERGALPPGDYESRVRIPGDLLNLGRFKLSPTLASPTSVERFARTYEPLTFDVVEDPTSPVRGLWETAFPGALRPLLDWSTARCEDRDHTAPTPFGRAEGHS